MAVILTSHFVVTYCRIPHYESRLRLIEDKLKEIPEYQENLAKIKLKIEKSITKIKSMSSL